MCYVDDLNEVEESNEYNNIRAIPIHIKNDLSDLSVSDFNWSNKSKPSAVTVAPGETITYSSSIINSGLGSSQTNQVKESVHFTKNRNEHLYYVNEIYERNLPALQVGEASSSGTHTYRIPKNLAEGTYYLTCYINNSQSELSKNNNKKVLTIQVKKKPKPKPKPKKPANLVVEILSLEVWTTNQGFPKYVKTDTIKYRNHGYKLKVKVSNKGEKPAPRVGLKLYIDNDGKFDLRENRKPLIISPVLTSKGLRAGESDDLIVTFETPFRPRVNDIKGGKAKLVMTVNLSHPNDVSSVGLNESSYSDNFAKLDVTILNEENQSGRVDYAELFGTSMQRSISLGILNQDKTLIATQSNESYLGFKNRYSGKNNQSSNDIFFKFKTTKKEQVSISTCGSGISDSYIHLLDANGKHIASNDDSNGSCGNNLHSKITQELYPGTFYIVAEGYGDQSGSITVSVSSEKNFNNKVGSSLSNPINLGDFDFSNTLSASNDNTGSNNFGNYYGQTSDDIFYKFNSLGRGLVNISTCGSGISDSYIYLLDANGNKVASNDDSSGACSNNLHSMIKKNLYPGTYYVVTEGYGDNSGNIKLKIESQISSVSRTSANSINSSNSSARKLELNNEEKVLNVEEPKQVTIYPNPTTDLIFVEYPSKSEQITIDVKLLDVRGQEVLSKNFKTVKGKNKYPLDLTNLSTGVYFVIINDGVELIKRKVIKK